jgi:hypothetical protein
MNGWVNAPENIHNLTIVHSADCGDGSFACPGSDGTGAQSGHYIQIIANSTTHWPNNKEVAEATIVSPLLRNAFSTCKMVFKYACQTFHQSSSYSSVNLNCWSLLLKLRRLFKYQEEALNGRVIRGIFLLEL